MAVNGFLRGKLDVNEGEMPVPLNRPHNVCTPDPMVHMPALSITGMGLIALSKCPPALPYHNATGTANSVVPFKCTNPLSSFMH